MDTQVDIHRFDDAVMDLEKAMKANPPEPGGVLFYGSSTLANWRENGMDQKHLAPLKVTNNGFGGSCAEEALLFYHRLVVPVKPSIILYYEGVNDLKLADEINGVVEPHRSYTPCEVLDMTHRLFEWTRQDFPGVQFVIIPVKHAPVLSHISRDIARCNEMFSDYAKAHDDTHVVDIKPLIFKENGGMRTDIYNEDMLHHNAKGYAELGALVKPVLEKLYAEREPVATGVKLD